MAHQPIAPSHQSVRFSCPHCGALAHQYWAEVQANWKKKDDFPSRYDVEAIKELMAVEGEKDPEKRFSDFERFPEYIKLSEGELFVSEFRQDPWGYPVHRLDISKCDSCNDVCIWINDKLSYPNSGSMPSPNSDMPPRVRSLYDEAASVFYGSPRSSAALLRLALEELLIELEVKGKDINARIDTLQTDGLPKSLIKVMHSLRIIGNESVHPGVISVDDDPKMAEAMFRLLNEIIEQLITRPREREELWDMLPVNKTKPVEDKLE